MKKDQMQLKKRETSVIILVPFVLLFLFLSMDGLVLSQQATGQQEHPDHFLRVTIDNLTVLDTHEIDNRGEWSVTADINDKIIDLSTPYDLILNKASNFSKVGLQSIFIPVFAQDANITNSLIQVSKDQTVTFNNRPPYNAQSASVVVQVPEEGVLKLMISGNELDEDEYGDYVNLLGLIPEVGGLAQQLAGEILKDVPLGDVQREYTLEQNWGVGNHSDLSSSKDYILGYTVEEIPECYDAIWKKHESLGGNEGYLGNTIDVRKKSSNVTRP